MTLRPLIALGMLAAGFGCQAEPPALMTDPALLTGRSLALPSASVRHLSEQQRAAGTLPWYADRRDVQPYAEWGVADDRVEDTETFVNEWRHQHGSRVDDHLHIRTYRTSRSSGIR